MARMTEEESKNLAKKAAREAVLEFHKEDSDPSEELTSQLDVTNDIEDKKADVLGFDIFDDIGETLTQKGDIIRYLVKKYGQHLATVDHPYSWERIKTQYGPGTYTVIARSHSRNKFVKQECRVIAKDDFKAENMEAPKTQSTSQMSMAEIVVFMQQQQEAARSQAEEARRQAREEAQGQMNQMTQMFQSIVAVVATQNAPKQDNSFELFKMQMEMQSRTTEQMMNSQREMFKALSERMEKLAEPKKESWDTATIMKMTEDARNAGMDMAQNLFELAEKKAEEKASLVEELREEIRSSISENNTNTKKSMSDSLIETILPTVAQALAQKAQPQQPQYTPQQIAMIQNRQNQARILQQRKQLAARNKKLAEQEQLRREVAGQTPATDSKDQHEATNEEVQNSETSYVDPNFGSLGTVHSEAPIVEEVSLHQEEVVRDVAIHAKCAEILPIFLGQMMMESVEAHIAADKTLEFLNQNGITRQMFLENVEVHDLTKVADDFALPQEAKIWLNELYGHIAKSNT